MCLAAALSRAPGLGPTSLALPGRRILRKTYFTSKVYSIVSTRACRATARTHTHTRTHEASYVQYKSEAKTKKKQKKKSGETSLALRCVGHTHNAPDILHPACKQRDRRNLGWLSRPGDARFQIPGLQALELHAAACAAAPCCSAAYLRGGPAGRKRSVVCGWGCGSGRVQPRVVVNYLAQDP